MKMAVGASYIIWHILINILHKLVPLYCCSLKHFFHLTSSAAISFSTCLYFLFFLLYLRLHHLTGEGAQHIRFKSELTGHSDMNVQKVRIKVNSDSSLQKNEPRQW